MVDLGPMDEMTSMIERVGLDFGEFQELYGKEKIADALSYAKDLKDRYTVLWLAYKYFNKEDLL